jgi:glutaminyl-peptide cyclotransferase
MRTAIFVLVLLFTLGCDNASSNGTPVNRTAANTAAQPVREPVKTDGYTVVNTFPHDPKAFTQGLMHYDGYLYESTGQYGSSTLRKVELKTGRVLQQHRLPSDYFGEGLTILNGKIYQLTWRERTVFVYNLENFKLEKELRYAGEGWGLTDDGTNLIMTDGTHVIRFVDPDTFRTLRTITVLREDGKPLMNLNELEYINGEIWANIWHSEDPKILGRTNHIARIDPSNGNLLGYIDLTGISPEDQRRDTENTLNGIAYDRENDRIFVTGKNWRRLFEIKLESQE